MGKKAPDRLAYHRKMYELDLEQNKKGKSENDHCWLKRLLNLLYQSLKGGYDK